MHDSDESVESEGYNNYAVQQILGISLSDMAKDFVTCKETWLTEICKGVKAAVAFHGSPVEAVEEIVGLIEEVSGRVWNLL